MTGILGNIANNTSQGADQEERVSSGGSRYDTSGCYTAIIKMAKVNVADSGAIGITLELEDADGNKTYITEWIQSGTAKGNKTTYTDKKSGDEINLPGFTKIKNLNFLINNVFGLPDSEPKQIQEYDYEAKQDALVNKDVVVSWIEKPIGICVQMTKEDKYNDEANFVVKPIVEHFYDPTTDLFGSEKMNSKPAENKAKFLEYISKNPEKDKRNKSKDSTSTANQNTSGNTTTANAGF